MSIIIIPKWYPLEEDAAAAFLQTDFGGYAMAFAWPQLLRLEIKLSGQYYADWKPRCRISKRCESLIRDAPGPVVQADIYTNIK